MSEVRTPFDPGYLRDLFNRSARYYDQVNTVTSFGQVGRWRRKTVALTAPRPDDRVLDAFCGTGGLAAEALPYLSPGGELVLADLSPVMLQRARDRIRGRLAAGADVRPPVTYYVADILAGPPNTGRFDVVLLGWGLRYVPDVRQALLRIRELVGAGGRLGVLEFTHPRQHSWAAPAHIYFRKVLPRIGSWLAADAELHQYLHVSSAAFPDAQTLADLIESTGLSVTKICSYLGGLVTIVAAKDMVFRCPQQGE